MMSPFAILDKAVQGQCVPNQLAVSTLSMEECWASAIAHVLLAAVSSIEIISSPLAVCTSTETKEGPVYRLGYRQPGLVLRGHTCKS